MKNALFLILFLLHSIGVFSQQGKGDFYFKEAKEWLDKGDNTNAIQSFAKSQAEFLQEKNYYRYYISTQATSIVYQEINDGESAEKIIQDAILLIPKESSEQIELHAKLQSDLGYTYLNVMNDPEKALVAYTKSINFYTEIGKGNSKPFAQELINRSLANQQLAHYQLSIDDLVGAVSVFKKNEDTSLEDIANCYYTIGLNQTELQEYEKALASFNQGISLINSSKKTEMLGMFYNAIGNTFKSQHKFQLAIENYKRAKDLTESIFGKDADNYCQPLVNIGEANKSMGDWNTALLNYQEALFIYQKTPPKSSESVIYLFLDIARTLNGLGQSEKSNQVVDQALAYAENVIGKNSLEEAEIYKHKAVVAYNDGESNKSLTYNFKALSILEANHYPKNPYYAELYDAVGQAYDALEDVNLALKYKLQAKEIYSNSYGENHSTVAMTIGSMGLSYEIINQNDQALELLHQSEAILLKSPKANEKDLGITYMDIGRNYLIKQDLKKAIENLEKAKIIFDADFKSYNKAKIYNELGAAYSIANNQQKAIECFQKSIVANTFQFENLSIDMNPTKEDYINYYDLISSYISKADWFRIKGDKANLLKGLQQLEAADLLIKKTANDFSNSADRLKLSKLNAFFTEAGMQLVDNLFRLTKDERFIEKAFYFSERSKANELFSDIQQSNAKSLARIPKEILSKKAELQIRLNNLTQQLASAYAEQNLTLITKLKTEEFELTKERQEVQTKMEELAPKLSSINNNRALPKWSDLKKIIEPTTILVSYTITDSAKYVLVCSKKSTILKKIKSDIDLDKLIRGYINQLKFQESSYKQLASRITNLIWAPVEEAMAEMGMTQPEKIIIIPEGPLNYLPFESLGADRFLIEKYIIHYSYSAALLLNTDKPVSKEKFSIVAMAPVFADKETNFVTKSCERFVEYSKKADNTSRAFSVNGDYITPLPGTRTEVEKINQIHVAKGLTSRFFLEEDASEGLIKKGELEKFNIIHLATHGFVNSQYPELSGLLLTQDPKSTEDGILYTGEILGLSLHAELVTLSACETALGKKIEGEGVRGLSTAFLFAGAKNVIASLWKVSDASTSELMIEFYSELLSGKDKATSLRLAKLRLIKSSNFNNPYYWAPFIQVGTN